MHIILYYIGIFLLLALAFRAIYRWQWGKYLKVYAIRDSRGGLFAGTYPTKEQAQKAVDHMTTNNFNVGSLRVVLVRRLSDRELAWLASPQRIQN